MSKATFSRMKLTAAGNYIFTNTHGSGYRTIGKVEFPSDTPLFRIKVRGGGRYSWDYRIEGLNKPVRDNLSKLGIETAADLVSAIDDKDVRKALDCSDAVMYAKMLKATFPVLTDPTYVVPVTLPIPTVTLEGDRANRFRALSKEAQKIVLNELGDIILENIDDELIQAHFKSLAMREAELEAQLANVRCQLGGGTDC